METVNKGIRFPVDLLRKIEELAEKEQRTFSQEVLYLCEKGIEVWNMSRKIEEEAIVRVAEGKDKEQGGMRQAQ